MPPMPSVSPAWTRATASPSVNRLCRVSADIRFDSEIQILDDRGSLRFLARAGECDRAVLEHVNDIREIHREARILLDEQHREPALFDQLAHHLEHLLDQDGR